MVAAGEREWAVVHGSRNNDAQDIENIYIYIGASHNPVGNRSRSGRTPQFGSLAPRTGGTGE